MCQRVCVYEFWFFPPPPQAMQELCVDGLIHLFVFMTHTGATPTMRHLAVNTLCRLCGVCAYQYSWCCVRRQTARIERCTYLFSYTKMKQSCFFLLLLRTSCFCFLGVTSLFEYLSGFRFAPFFLSVSLSPSLLSSSSFLFLFVSLFLIIIIIVSFSASVSPSSSSSSFLFLPLSLRHHHHHRFFFCLCLSVIIISIWHHHHLSLSHRFPLSLSTTYTHMHAYARTHTRIHTRTHTHLNSCTCM